MNTYYKWRVDFVRDRRSIQLSFIVVEDCKIDAFLKALSMIDRISEIPGGSYSLTAVNKLKTVEKDSDIVKWAVLTSGVSTY